MSDIEKMPDVEAGNGGNSEIQKRSLQIASSFAGPIPPPEILLSYEQVQPGLAERIVAMAEKEQSHRHDIDNKTIQIQADELEGRRQLKRTGQNYGLSIALTCIVLGSILVAIGFPVAGTTISTGVVISLVSVFVIGKTVKSSEDEMDALDAEAFEELPPKEEEELPIGTE